MVNMLRVCRCVHVCCAYVKEQIVSAGGDVPAGFRGGASIRDDEAGAWHRLDATTVQVLHGSVEGKPYSFSDV